MNPQTILDYLEVGLSQEEQQLLLLKLDAVNSANLDAYKKFPEVKQKAFLNDQYPERWKQQFTQQEEYLELFNKEMERRLNKLPENEREQADMQHIRSCTEARLMRFVNISYQHHAEAISLGEVQAVTSFEQDMLAYYQERHNNFLVHQQMRYKGLANTLERLGKVIERIEGDNHANTPDFRRWAHFLAHAEEGTAAHELKALKIGLSRDEKSEAVENWAQTAVIVLKMISLGIAIFSITTHLTNFFTEEAFKEGLEEGAVSFECGSLLVAGLILCLKGDTNLGRKYLGLGGMMLTAEIVTGIADFGPHFMSAAGSASVLAFVGGACCLALAYINHGHMQEAIKRNDVVMQKISEIEQELDDAYQPERDKEKLQGEQLSLERTINIINQQLPKRLDYEEKLREMKQSKILLDESEHALEQIRSDRDKCIESINSAEQDLALLENNSEAQLVDKEKLKLKISQSREELEMLDSELDISHQEMRQRTVAYQQALHLAQQHPGKNLESREVLTAHLETAQNTLASNVEKIEAIQQQLSKLKELQQTLTHERDSLYAISFAEKAAIKDCKMNRNYFIAYGVSLIAVGTITLALGSAATMGVLPIALLAVSAVGLGLALIKRYVIGNNPHAEKIKHAHHEIESFSKFIDTKDLIVKHLAIEDGQYVALKSFLHDLIVDSPDKAEVILEKLEQLSQVDISPQNLIEYKQDLSRLLEANGGKKLAAQLELHEEDDEREGYQCDGDVVFAI